MIAKNRGVYPPLPSLSAVLRGLRDRSVRSEALTRRLLDRLNALNPILNMVLVQRDLEVLREAREADARLDAGCPLGPLDGLPVSIKDCYDTEGIVTTSGCLHRATRVPERDATVVHRWRSLGALVLAKSNVPELGYGIETDNLLVGRTRNPWNLERTIGGSSGGEAALIASHCSLLGLGSDSCGSLRLPAHFGGIASLKMTNSAVPKDGHPPLLAPFIGELASVGPMARTVEDLAIGHAALLDDRARLDALISHPAQALVARPTRVVVAFSDDPALSVECRDALKRAADALAQGGCEVRYETHTAVSSAERLWEDIVRSDGEVAMRQAIFDGKPVHPVLELFRNVVGTASRHYIPLMWLFLGLFQRYPSLETALAHRQAQWDALDASLEPGAVLLMPVTPRAAHAPQDVRVFRTLLKYVKVANVFQLPAVTLPVLRGGEGQLPVGVQLLARPGEDISLLETSYLLEQVLAHSPAQQPVRKAA